MWTLPPHVDDDDDACDGVKPNVDLKMLQLGTHYSSISTSSTRANLELSGQLRHSLIHTSLMNR